MMKTDGPPPPVAAPANDNHAFCPCCGHNLAAEHPVAIGPLDVDPRGLARWHGQSIRLTPSQFLLFSALAQARGRLVTKDILAERAGYEGEGDAHDVVEVLICRIRHALRLVGCPTTVIQSVRGRGCRLDLDMLADLEAEARSC